MTPTDLTHLFTVRTPAGPLTILATSAGAVAAAAFTADPAELPVPGAADLPPPGDPAATPDAVHRIAIAVESYLDGDLAAIDSIPVTHRSPGAPASRGDFQERVWRELRRLKPGDPVTYTQLATLAGRPAAVRAAANACARNAIALFVPCHRVYRIDGGLGGYRWGTGVKEWLLRHEGAR